MKIWIWVKNKNIYAYTTNKELRDRFIYERNMSYFSGYKCIKLTSEEYNVFKSEYSVHELFLNSLYTGKENINLVTTYCEDDILTTHCDNISKLADMLRDYIPLFSKKNQKYIKELCNISEIRELKDYKENVLTLNTFGLFLKIFKNCF